MQARKAALSDDVAGDADARNWTWVDEAARYARVFGWLFQVNRRIQNAAVDRRCTQASRTLTAVFEDMALLMTLCVLCKVG